MELWNALTRVPMPVLIAILAVMIVVTVYCIVEHAKLKGLEGIRGEVYQLMLMAEHGYRSGAGKQKLKYVVSRARQLLPKWMQFFITDDMLVEIIDMWFREIKDLLDDGKINESAADDK